ncbi:MAG: hypothetical protein AAGC92_09590 [Pseudomonadota bacterium]
MTKHDRGRPEATRLTDGLQPIFPVRHDTSTRAMKRHIACMYAFPDPVERSAVATLVDLTRVLEGEAALIERVLHLLGALPVDDARRIAAQARQALGEALDTVCAPDETVTTVLLRVQEAPERFSDPLRSAADGFSTALQDLEVALIRVESRI